MNKCYLLSGLQFNSIQFSVSVFCLDLRYSGILVIKNRTASRAMSPGKKRYMAFLKPMASPTCSTSIPRVPVRLTNIKLLGQWGTVDTCDDVHHTEENRSAEASGVAGHDLHDDSEEDGEPGLSKEVVESQSYETIGRPQVESQGGEGSCEDQEPGLDPQAGVEAKPGLQLVCYESSWRRG